MIRNWAWEDENLHAVAKQQLLRGSAPCPVSPPKMVEQQVNVDATMAMKYGKGFPREIPGSQPK